MDDAAVRSWVWSRLAVAADAPDDPLHLHVLSTIAPHGEPDVRLMVIRGVAADHARLWYHADASSTKVAQIRANPAACLLVYDPQSELQLRLRGTASLVESEEEIRAHWQHIRALVQQLRQGDAASPAHDLRLDALNRSDHDPWWQPDQFAVIEFNADVIDLHVPHAGRPVRRTITASSAESAVTDTTT